MPRRSRVIGPVIALTAITALLMQTPTASAGASDRARAQDQQRVAVASKVSPKGFGVAVANAPGDMAPIRELAAKMGRKPDRIAWYVAWSTKSDFPVKHANAVTRYGATPAIAWEPWDPSRGVDQTTYSPRSIAAGEHDTYVRQWARQIRRWGKPVVLRFAHEANGNWYPWGVGQGGGTTAADYVAMWRHVHGIFRRQGATNAVWQFSANVPYFGSTDIASIFPGDRFVHEVGLNGYNWSGLIVGTEWASFTDLFAAGTRQLQELSDRPLRITETATPEGLTSPDGADDKAAWIHGMFDRLRQDDTYAGITWFSFDKEADWRIDSSDASLQAFREELATY